jgi:Condensation domain.
MTRTNQSVDMDVQAVSNKLNPEMKLEKSRFKSEVYTTSTIPRGRHEGPVEQSFAQSRLWFLDRLYPQSTSYVMPFALRLQGPLQVQAMQAALLALEERHETLRTTFDQQDGAGLQIVHPFHPKKLTVTNVPPHDDEFLSQALWQDQMTPFDLKIEPGWRISLYRLNEDHHVLSIMMHHIISDGWSVDILRRELAVFYAASIRGQDPLSQVAPLPIQYRDFAIWQKQQEQTEQHQQQLSYWVKQLEGSRPAEFLYDKPRPSILSGKADMQSVVIEGAVYESLEQFARTTR